MSARDDTLRAVREALNTPPRDAATIRAEAAALLGEPQAIRPALAQGSLADVFAARVTTPKVAATVDRVAGAIDLPDAVHRYVRQRGLAPALALQPAPALIGLDWSGFELHDQVAGDEILAVGVALWGIAETGSLVFHSSPSSPVLNNFLPLHHIVLLHERDILAYLEDYAAAVRRQRPPRNANLITGASGTTDIEGSLVLGAHGPAFLHVVIAAD